MKSQTFASLAGLVVHLDTTALRALGVCQTNAERTATEDRAVTGEQNFLVVFVDQAHEMCTAVPLFAKTMVGNQPLVERLKSGRPDGWIGVEQYFSRWQHWRIPTSVIVDAISANGDDTNEMPRYAASDSSVLDDIRVWESRNRAPYRPV